MTSYWSGVSCSRHSCSDFMSFSVATRTRLPTVAGVKRGLAALVCVLAAGCGGSDETATTRSPASSLEDRGRVNDPTGPLAVRDVTFASRGGRVEGFLVVPPGRKRLPAAVYVHGAGGDRSQLLVQAGWLAARGAVALTITAPSSVEATPPGLDGLAALEWQREVAERDVAAVRRAVDALASRSEVDAGRIGFVGWSAGARTGALVAAVEPRIDAFVLMSGGAEPVAAYAREAPAELRADVERILGAVDPLRSIGRARPGTLLLQNGRRDEVVPQRALKALAKAAAPARPDVRWYPAGHELGDAAYRDQLAWLQRKLRISGPPVPGAPTGP
jgi:dienelactone hydrolase